MKLLCEQQKSYVYFHFMLSSLQLLTLIENQNFENFESVNESRVLENEKLTEEDEKQTFNIISSRCVVYEISRAEKVKWKRHVAQRAHQECRQTGDRTGKKIADDDFPIAQTETTEIYAVDLYVFPLRTMTNIQL